MAGLSILAEAKVRTRGNADIWETVQRISGRVLFVCCKKRGTGSLKHHVDPSMQVRTLTIS